MVWQFTESLDEVETGPHTWRYDSYNLLETAQVARSPMRRSARSSRTR